MQRNRQDLYSIDVNHDVYMDKYLDLTPESLGEHYLTIGVNITQPVAFMSAGIEALRTFLLEQEEVLPKLCLVSDLQLKYNDYVKSSLSDHITKFSERLAEAIPGLKRFTVGQTCYVCFDSLIVAKMNRDNDA